MEIFREAQTYTYPEVDKIETESGFSLDRDFMNELALHTQVVVKSSPMMWAHGRLLYSTLSAYLKTLSPSSRSERITILETGTARGYSAICMAKALHDADLPGVIFTTDIVPHETPIYWNCIDDLEGKKSRRELLSPWKELVDKYIVFMWGDSQLSLNTVSWSRINYAFLDGGHTYDDVMVEFSKVGKYQKSGDIVIFDDVTPHTFPGVAQAVADICRTEGYERQDVMTHNNRIHAVCRKR